MNRVILYLINQIKSSYSVNNLLQVSPSHGIDLTILFISPTWDTWLAVGFCYW